MFIVAIVRLNRDAESYGNQGITVHMMSNTWFILFLSIENTKFDQTLQAAAHKTSR